MQPQQPGTCLFHPSIEVALSTLVGYKRLVAIGISHGAVTVHVGGVFHSIAYDLADDRRHVQKSAR
jgi:hypothetical protein